MPAYLVHRALKYPENFRNAQEFLDDRANWSWKDVAAGAVADDIPTVSRASRTAAGDIEPVEKAAARIALALEAGEPVADYEQAFLTAWQAEQEAEDGSS